MSGLIQVYSVLKYAAEVGFPQRKRGLSAANAFHKANKKCCKGEVGGETTIDYEHIRCSNGTLFPPLITATLDAETKTLHIESEAMADDTNCYADDTVYAAVLDKENLLCRLVEVSKRGEEGTKSVPLPRYWNMESLEMYAFTVTKDGKRASKTIYVAV